MILLGLTGRAGCGKDTVAGILARRHGFHPIAFADPLRAGLRALLGITPAEFDALVSDREAKERPIDWLGRSPRYLLQTLGTEWGRHMVHQDIWLRIAARRLLEIARWIERDGEKDIPPAPRGVVITDVRFENEADFIRENGGVVVHIYRDNLEAVRPHVSEAGVSRDRVRDLPLYNTGTIDELHARVAGLVYCVRKGQPA